MITDKTVLSRTTTSLLDLLNREGLEAHLEDTGGGCTALVVTYPKTCVDNYPQVMITDLDGGQMPDDEGGIMIGYFTEFAEENAPTYTFKPRQVVRAAAKARRLLLDTKRRD